MDSDCLLCIVNFLQLHDILNCFLIDKQFSLVVSNEIIWKSLFDNKFNKPPAPRDSLRSAHNCALNGIHSKRSYALSVANPAERGLVKLDKNKMHLIDPNHVCELMEFRSQITLTKNDKTGEIEQYTRMHQF